MMTSLGVQTSQVKPQPSDSMDNHVRKCDAILQRMKPLLVSMSTAAASGCTQSDQTLSDAAELLTIAFDNREYAKALLIVSGRESLGYQQSHSQFLKINKTWLDLIGLATQCSIPGTGTSIIKGPVSEDYVIRAMNDARYKGLTQVLLVFRFQKDSIRLKHMPINDYKPQLANGFVVMTPGSEDTLQAIISTRRLKCPWCEASGPQVRRMMCMN